MCHISEFGCRGNREVTTHYKVCHNTKREVVTFISTHQTKLAAARQNKEEEIT